MPFLADDDGVDYGGDYDDDDNENDDNGSFSGFCVAIPRHGPPRSRLRGHAQGTRMPKYFRLLKKKTVLLKIYAKLFFRLCVLTLIDPRYPRDGKGTR